MKGEGRLAEDKGRGGVGATAYPHLQSLCKHFAITYSYLLPAYAYIVSCKLAIYLELATGLGLQEYKAGND